MKKPPDIFLTVALAFLFSHQNPLPSSIILRKLICSKPSSNPVNLNLSVQFQHVPSPSALICDLSGDKLFHVVRSLVLARTVTATSLIGALVFVSGDTSTYSPESKDFIVECQIWEVHDVSPKAPLSPHLEMVIVSGMFSFYHKVIVFLIHQFPNSDLIITFHCLLFSVLPFNFGHFVHFVTVFPSTFKMGHSQIIDILCYTNTKLFLTEHVACQVLLFLDMSEPLAEIRKRINSRFIVYDFLNNVFLYVLEALRDQLLIEINCSKCWVCLIPVFYRIVVACIRFTTQTMCFAMPRFCYLNEYVFMFFLLNWLHFLRRAPCGNILDNMFDLDKFSEHNCVFEIFLVQVVSNLDTHLLAQICNLDFLHHLLIFRRPEWSNLFDYSFAHDFSVLMILGMCINCFVDRSYSQYDKNQLITSGMYLSELKVRECRVCPHCKAYFLTVPSWKIELIVIDITILYHFWLIIFSLFWTVSLMVLRENSDGDIVTRDENKDIIDKISLSVNSGPLRSIYVRVTLISFCNLVFTVLLLDYIKCVNIEQIGLISNSCPIPCWVWESSTLNRTSDRLSVGVGKSN